VLQHNGVLALELDTEPYVAPLPSLRRLSDWNRGLRADPERLAYLHDVRGLDDRTINRYELGHDGERYVLPVRTHGHKGRLVNVRRYLPEPPPGQRKMLGKAGRGIQLYPCVPGSKSVLLCEGEWDALLAIRHGLPAVTSTGGVNGWEADWNPAFTGSVVAIVFDCDAEGRLAAAARGRELCAAGAWVKVVDLGLEDKEDLTDHFVKYGHSAADLLTLIRQTPLAYSPGIEAVTSTKMAARPKTIKESSRAANSLELSTTDKGVMQ
jgi:hypothetical protein